MLDFIECLKDVVGLTKKECNCPEFDNEPADPAPEESLSGYYIDDFEYGVPLKVASNSSDCGDGGVWDLLQNAREDGIRDFQTDFIGLVRDSNDFRLKRFEGRIGDHDKVNSELYTKSVVGARITPWAYKGAKMLIKAISLYTNAPNDTVIPLDIYSSQDYTTPLHTVNVTVKNKKYFPSALQTPIELPFTDQSGNAIQYYFVYEPGAHRPSNVVWNCGCGNNKREWESYFEGKGFEIDNISELQNAKVYSKNTYGIQLDARVSCFGVEWICDEKDYSVDPWARVMARVLQLYQIRKMIGYVINSEKINRYTLVARDAINGKRNRLNKEIETRMQWMVTTLPTDVTDCFICNDTSGISKHEIIV